MSASSGPEIEAQNDHPDAAIMREEEVIPRDQHGSDSEGDGTFFFILAWDLIKNVSIM